MNDYRNLKFLLKENEKDSQALDVVFECYIKNGESFFKKHLGPILEEYINTFMNKETKSEIRSAIVSEIRKLVRERKLVETSEGWKFYD